MPPRFIALTAALTLLACTTNDPQTHDDTAADASTSDTAPDVRDRLDGETARDATTDVQPDVAGDIQLDAGPDAGPGLLPYADWMRDLLNAPETPDGVALVDLCLPRSHDTGTYELTTCSLGALACNTQTQHLWMSAQLEAGVRVFDVRPQLVEGEFFTHHTISCGSLGCQGDSVASLLAQVRAFVDAHAELVILQVEHYCDTSPTDPDLVALVADTLGDRLYTEAEDAPDADVRFSERPLRTLIPPAAGTGKVLMLWGSLPNQPAHRAAGRFASSFIHTEGGWSNKQDADELVADQLKRYRNYKEGDDTLFEFSWTLTMDGPLAAACLTDEAPRSIKSMAAEVNDVLASNLDALIAAEEIRPGRIPNMISVDFADTFVTDQALRINALNLAGAQEATVKLPPADARFDYQLGGAYPSEAPVVIRDPSDAPQPGAYNVCYVNAFQVQDVEEAQWLTVHPHLILKGGDGSYLEDPDWSEYLIDFRTAAQRADLLALFEPQLQACKDKGFDAIELDNLDTFTRTEHTEGLLTEAHAVAYAKALVTAAHGIGLAAAQKNTSEKAAAFKAAVGFDFAISEECWHYDECSDYAPYDGRVYAVEYTQAAFDAGCAANTGPKPQLRDRDLQPPAAGGTVAWCP